MVGSLLVAAVVFGGLLGGDDEPVEVVDNGPAAPTGPEAVNVSEPGLIEGALDTVTSSRTVGTATSIRSPPTRRAAC